MDEAGTVAAQWVQPEDIVIDVDARTRSDVLHAIASAVARRHALDPQRVFRALERRELAGSTGFGHGFAIPHARIAGVERPLTLYLRTRTGVAFGAPDGTPVRDFIAIIVPVDGDRNAHLLLLALIAKLFSGGTFRRMLNGAVDPQTASVIFQVAVQRLGEGPA